jgi:hypothetical protein
MSTPWDEGGWGCSLGCPQLWNPLQVQNLIHNSPVIQRTWTRDSRPSTKTRNNLQYKGRHWCLPMFLSRDKQASTPDLVLETREEALSQSNKEWNTQEHCAHTGWQTRCLIAYMWRSYRFAGELSLHSNLLQFLAIFTIIHDPFILPTWDGQVRKTSNPPCSRLPFEIHNLMSNISTPFKLISLLSILANCKTIYYTWLHSLWLIINCS